MDLFSSLYAFEICALASGSSGNCYYVGNNEGGLLIDAGISSRKIAKLLQDIGKSIYRIKGILVTHDHIDHIKGIEALTKMYKIPIFATNETFEGIKRNRFTQHTSTAFHRSIAFDQTFEVGGFKITAFPVSHDAVGASGFFIENSGRSFAFATDLGFVCETAKAYLKKANVLAIESNYDDDMLTNGPYPAHLKDRIRGDKGHLSNKQAADFISQVYHKQMSHIFLIHLSHHNNMAEKVHQTINATLGMHRIVPDAGTTIMHFERDKRSAMYRIE